MAFAKLRRACFSEKNFLKYFAIWYVFVYNWIRFCIIFYNFDRLLFLLKTIMMAVIVYTCYGVFNYRRIVLKILQFDVVEYLSMHVPQTIGDHNLYNGYKNCLVEFS